MIKQITIVTAQGVCTYKAGECVPYSNNKINNIRVEKMIFNGDEYDHFYGFQR